MTTSPVTTVGGFGTHAAARALGACLDVLPWELSSGLGESPAGLMPRVFVAFVDSPWQTNVRPTLAAESWDHRSKKADGLVRTHRDGPKPTDED
jgi:hypothetical protein